MLVLGTHNAKKAQELRQLLTPHNIKLKSLDDFPTSINVVEDGDSFQANAELKARQQSMHLNQWVIGEDSGLCVDALDGAPGIYSARFSGAEATDESNNCLLLEQLQDVAAEKRSAFYVCHISLSDPQGRIRASCEATCRGRIRRDPKGNLGFGYDPLFEILELHRTFAELGPHVKGALSHRGRALRRFLPQLLQQYRSCVG